MERSETRRGRSLVLVLILAGIPAFQEAARSGSEAPPAFDFPEDIWRGFDPAALPLEIEVLQSSQESGAWIEKFRFTAEEVQGGKARILAIRGAPLGKEGVPGILHIHGGGQTLSRDWVKFWSARGFACLSFDFCGPAYDRKEFTDWGPLERCNMMKYGDGNMSAPDPRDSAWFHWTLAARRALTVLAKTPGVDPGRLGIFGVSVGGTLTWLVAGSDHRVKAAVPIYGCGYNVDDRRPPLEAAAPSEAQWNFKRVLSPEAWAPYVNCPLLFLSATNDMHGRIHTAYEILGVLRGEVRQAFTPRYDHHVGPEQAEDLPLWMDRHLRGGAPWPGTPGLRIALNPEGVPAASISADRPEEVRKVEVLYSLGDKVPGARFWRTAAAERKGDLWTSSLPVWDAWRSLWAFANVHYRSGICLSSNFFRLIPGQIGRARGTLRWTPSLVDPAGGIETWYFVPAYTDPNIRRAFLLPGDDGASGRSFGLNPEAFGSTVNFHIGTHAIGDPDHEGREGMALAFEFKGKFDAGFTVRLVYGDRLMGSRVFEAQVSPGKDPAIWEAAVLPLASFKGEGGKPPETWKGADKIEIKGSAQASGPPWFRGFRWEMEIQSKKESK